MENDGKPALIPHKMSFGSSLFSSRGACSLKKYYTSDLYYSGSGGSDY
jgi:hypothetical protein